MGDVPVNEVMDAMEERAESNLQLLTVLETAQMMRVTRETITATLEEEQRQERERFQALREAAGADDGPRTTGPASR